MYSCKISSFKMRLTVRAVPCAYPKYRKRATTGDCPYNLPNGLYKF